MEKITVREDNELIIGLDEFKLIKAFYPEFRRKAYLESNDIIIGWSELMPVVEKIESLGHEVKIWKTYCTIDSSFCAYPKKNSKIEAVYQSVIKFILWYNTTKGR